MFRFLWLANTKLNDTFIFDVSQIIAEIWEHAIPIEEPKKWFSLKLKNFKSRYLIVWIIYNNFQNTFVCLWDIVIPFFMVFTDIIGIIIYYNNITVQ